ncbi:MAG: hypothetical protein HWD61_13980 [Parachlamydiaceae bacterium]|nr:MAG: hypothetical protein HWD61_13980 [Parachlamydiaceae bacterium]
MKPIGTVERIPCYKQYVLNLEDAEKLLKSLDVPEQAMSGIGGLTKLIQNQGEPLKIHQCQISQLWGIDIHIENTLSLTLASLSPTLRQFIEEIKLLADPIQNIHFLWSLFMEIPCQSKCLKRSQKMM